MDLIPKIVMSCHASFNPLQIQNIILCINMIITLNFLYYSCTQFSIMIFIMLRRVFLISQNQTAAGNVIYHFISQRTVRTLHIGGEYHRFSFPYSLSAKLSSVKHQFYLLFKAKWQGQRGNRRGNPSHTWVEMNMNIGRRLFIFYRQNISTVKYRISPNCSTRCLDQFLGL